jgi:hypothetical protein
MGSSTNEKLDLSNYINGVSGGGLLRGVCTDILADQVVGDVLARDREERVVVNGDLNEEYQ